MSHLETGGNHENQSNVKGGRIESYKEPVSLKVT